jgi:hypothetical protein
MNHAPPINRSGLDRNNLLSHHIQVHFHVTPKIPVEHAAALVVPKRLERRVTESAQAPEEPSCFRQKFISISSDHRLIRLYEIPSIGNLFLAQNL